MSAAANINRIKERLLEIMKKNGSCLYKSIIIGVISAVTLLSGCVETFNYKVDSESAKIKATPFSSSIVVKNFADERTIMANDTNNTWLAALPLVPLGWGNFSRPEKGLYFFGTTSLNFKPSIDLAKATADSMKHSGLFENVYYADEFTNFKNANYILTGIIYSTNYNEKIISYGLSVGSPILWILGLPSGTTTNQLKLRFLLKNAKTDKIVWSYMMNKEANTTQWIYSSGAEFKNYVPITKKGVNEALRNLSKFMNSNPDMFTSKSAT